MHGGEGQRLVSWARKSTSAEEEEEGIRVVFSRIAGAIESILYSL
jgi:hypothetical protein